MRTGLAVVGKNRHCFVVQVKNHPDWRAQVKNRSSSDRTLVKVGHPVARYTSAIEECVG